MNLFCGFRFCDEIYHEFFSIQFPATDHDRVLNANSEQKHLLLADVDQ